MDLEEIGFLFLNDKIQSERQREKEAKEKERNKNTENFSRLCVVVIFHFVFFSFSVFCICVFIFLRVGCMSMTEEKAGKTGWGAQTTLPSRRRRRSRGI